MSAVDFALSATWPTAPQNGVRDVAHISLSVANEVLTRLSDFERKEDRDYVRGSGVSLAFWFADNWWRLRYESLPDSSYPSVNWRLRHELTSAAGGALWPPLMIHSTGDRILIAPAAGRAVDIGALRYPSIALKSVSAPAYEAGLDVFFGLVLGACIKAADGDALAALLKDLAAEREDPETSAWRRLEARLGYDPDTAPTTLMNVMGGFGRRVGEAAVEEAALAVQGSDAPIVLERAPEASNDSHVVVDLSIAQGISRARIRDRTAPPWQLAREAAHQVRQAAGLRDGPIPARQFRELFRTTEASLKAPGTARSLPYAAHQKGRGEQQKIALQSANQKDRRFELACVLGDQIWSQAEFGIVSKAKTDCQKFQRAFAQNLLVPYADLRRHIDEGGPTEHQIEAAAKQFYVHPHVIRQLLVIEGVASQPTIEEQLEAA